MRQYTPIERKMIAEIFRRAKKYLWDGKGTLEGTSYICHAIHETGHSGWFMASGVIRERLQKSSTVRTWLMYELGIPPFDLTYEVVQEYRHRWVDALIEEFSN